MAFQLAEGYVEISARGNKESERALAGIKREFDALNKAGMEVFANTRTPMEKYGAEVDRLSSLFEKGAISQDTYARAVDNAKRTMESSLPSYKNIGKFLLVGLGIGTAEQVVRKVVSEVSNLVKKMNEAAASGEAVGNGIARWATELTGLQTAVAGLDQLMANQEAGQELGKNADATIRQRLGVKEETGADVSAAYDKQIADLAKQKKGLENSKLGGFADFTRGLVGKDEKFYGDEIKGLKLEMQRLQNLKKIDKGRFAEADKAVEGLASKDEKRKERSQATFGSFEEFGRQVNLGGIKDNAAAEAAERDKERNNVLKEIAKNLGAGAPL